MTEFIDGKPIYPNVRYKYSVRGFKGDSLGAITEDIIVHTLLSPEIIEIRSVSSKSIALQFDHTGTLQCGYEIERSTDGLNYTSRIILDVGESSFIDTDLDVSQLYYYRISAVIDSHKSKPTFFGAVYTAYLDNGMNIPHHISSMRTISISPDGFTAAYSAFSTRVINSDNRELLFEYPDQKNHIVFNPDGTLIVMGKDDIRFGNASTGEIIKTIPIPANYLAYCPEGIMLISTTPYRTDAWNTRNYSRRWLSHRNNIRSVDVHISGDVVLRAGRSFIEELSIHDGTLIRGWEVPPNLTKAIYNFDGSIFAAGFSGSGGIHVYDTITGNMIVSMQGYGEGLESFTFTNQDFIISSYTNFPMVIYDPRHNRVFTQTLPISGSVTHIAVNAQSNRVILAHRWDGITIWDLHHGWTKANPMVH